MTLIKSCVLALLIGEIAKKYDSVFRIDEAVAKYIATNYSRIGVAYSVESTFNTSIKLLKSIALQLKKEIVIEPIDCTSSWEFFENQTSMVMTNPFQKQY